LIKTCVFCRVAASTNYDGLATGGRRFRPLSERVVANLAPAWFATIADEFNLRV
jgi:hypothetical protein